MLKNFKTGVFKRVGFPELNTDHSSNSKRYMLQKKCVKQGDTGFSGSWPIKGS